LASTGKIYFRILGLGVGSVALALHVSGVGLMALTHGLVNIPVLHRDSSYLSNIYDWLYRYVAPLCVINVMNIVNSTNVFRTKWRWSVPEIMQIGSGVLKMWADKRSGLGFFGHPVCLSKLQETTREPD